MTTKYHINPQTGNPNVCKAVYNCRFGNIDHYDSKDEARAGYERSMEAESMDTTAAIDSIENNFTVSVSNDWNPIQYNIDTIRNKLIPNAYLNQRDRENLLTLKEVASTLKKDDLTEDEYTAVRKKIDAMKPVYKSFAGGSSDNPASSIENLAKQLYNYRKAQDLEPVVAPPRKRNLELKGLGLAQQSAMINYNEYKTLYNYAENDLDPAIDRVVSGEKFTPVGYEETETQYPALYPKHAQVFKALSEEAGGASNNQLYLSTVFPERELSESMERIGVKDVQVKHFENTREWGNTYTVNQPDGSTRTFAVYEHRNTDSIIINGKQDWDPTKDRLPYAGETKNDFFAEFAPENKKQAADALAFYMKEAQNGELPDDTTLASSASKRDWTAILSDTIPGFKQWHEDQTVKEGKKGIDDIEEFVNRER